MSLMKKFEELKQSSRENELITEVQEIIGDETEDLGIHQNNFLNIAYFTGKQWLTFDKASNRVIEAPKDNSKVRITVNRIEPVVRANLGKMTKSKPVMTVVPASTEKEDTKSAKVADKVLEYLEDELNLQNIDRQAILWGLTTSIVFIKVFWDNDKGDIVPGSDVRLGNCNIDVINRFEVQYDRTAKNWNEVKWICINKMRDIGYVKAKYPEAKDKVNADDGLTNKNVYEVQLKNLGNQNNAFADKGLKNVVMVKEYWEKPSYKYPKGRRMTFTANGVLLFYSEDIGFGENDDTERELPIFPFVFVNVPGLVEGRSCVDNLRELQKEYNIARSQLINNKNMLAGSRWLVEEDSLTTGEITNDPDEVIEYKKGYAPPQQISATSISADVVNDINSLIEEFYFISGQNDVSHGNTNNSKVRSGIAIQYLEEQDDTKLGPTVKNWLDCKREYCKYLLKMVKYKYTEPRTLRIVGKDNQLEVVEFMGSELTSCDVRVQESSMLQESRTAKTERILSYVQQGILNVERDRELILKMLELGSTEYLYNEYAIDINQAHEEEYKWNKQDYNTITKDFFNHELHILEHNKFRKSEEYKQLLPKAQQIIDAHVQEHINWLVHANPSGPTMATGMQNDISSLQ